MHDSQTPKFAVNASRDSEEIVGYVLLSIEVLTELCSKEYAKKIIAANENGLLYGLYFTKTGRLKAVFI